MKPLGIVILTTWSAGNDRDIRSPSPEPYLYQYSLDETFSLVTNQEYAKAYDPHFAHFLLKRRLENMIRVSKRLLVFKLCLMIAPA